jgi:FeS assembly SUF system regulator
MFRLNKLTDYALVVMQYVAGHPEEPLHTARSLAAATLLPVPTVVKLLKELQDHGLLVSYRGVKGGYAPARPPSQITVAQIVEAIEGSIGFTECATAPGRCTLEGKCRVQDNSHIIGRTLQRALGNIKLSDLTAELAEDARVPRKSNLVTSITMSPGRVQ